MNQRSKAVVFNYQHVWIAVLLPSWLLIFSGLGVAQHLPTLHCTASKLDRQVSVKQVVDGDTLRLADGQLVRLIGINTPELARDGRPDEAHARAARDFVLAQMATTSSRVGLNYGAEMYDRYNRLLAHVYLTDGRSLQAALLAEGLAAQILVPPNLNHRACYRQAEALARTAERGVWQDLYRPMAVGAVSRKQGGFRILHGTIVRLGEARKSLWLNFSGLPGEGPREGVALRVSRADLEHFTDWQPADLVGRQIEVRGWWVVQKQQLVMSLRHPDAVRLLP